MEEFTDLNLIIGGFNVNLASSLARYSRELKIHYNSKVYRDLIDLYKESDVSIATIKIVLENNNINNSLINHISTIFEESKNLDELTIGLIREKFQNVIESVLIKEAEEKSTTPISFTDLVKKINVELKTSHELDKIMESINLSSVDLDGELDSLGDPIVSPIKGINALQTLGGYVPNQLVCVASPPASGKSLFLMYHALEFIKNNKKVIYFALGDLSLLDFCIRLVSMELKISMNDATKNIKEKFKEFSDRLGDKLNNLEIKLVDPGILGAEDIEKYCVDKKLDVPGSILIIDYDGNLKRVSENSYKEGIDQYNIFKALSASGRFDLVMIASQVNRAVHNEPIIYQSSLADSIGKLNVVDILFTIGKYPDSVNQIGYINLCKIRRGGCSAKFPYLRDISGRFITCSNAMYQVLKDEESLKLVLNDHPKVDEDSLLKEFSKSMKSESSK